MCRSGKQVLRPIVILGADTFGSDTPSSLGTVFSQGRTLHITLMRNSDYHFLIWNHVFVTEVLRIVLNLCTAIIRVAFLHFQKFSLDDLHSLPFISKNCLKLFDKGHDLFVFGNDFITLHASKALKSHIKDGSGLNFTQVKALHQTITGSFWVG